MLNQVTPYINAMVSQLPTFGKPHASVFVAGLFLESLYRIEDRSGAKLIKIFTSKVAQIAVLGASHTLFDSTRVKASVALCVALSQPTWLRKLSKKMDNQELKDNPDRISDRPRLSSFIGSGAEVVNIAAKIFCSLSTGVVVQQMITGQTEGKIRVAVSAILLAISAANVYKIIDYAYSKPFTLNLREPYENPFEQNPL